MLDVAPTEFLLVAFVALVVIGPKDLPKAMRVLGYWVGRARAVGRQFRAGFDEMVREAELEEMEKKWAAENERIMRAHPAPAATEALPPPSHAPQDADADGGRDPVSAQAVSLPHEERGDAPAQSSLAFDDPPPVMVEKPHVVPAPDTAPDTAPNTADDPDTRDTLHRDRAPS